MRKLSGRGPRVHARRRFKGEVVFHAARNPSQSEPASRALRKAVMRNNMCVHVALSEVARTETE